MEKYTPKNTEDGQRKPLNYSQVKDNSDITGGVVSDYNNSRKRNSGRVSYDAIADKYGICPSTAKRIVSEARNGSLDAGVKVAYRGRVTDDEVRQMAEIMAYDNKSAYRIARDLGRSASTVKKYLNQCVNVDKYNEIKEREQTAKKIQYAVSSELDKLDVQRAKESKANLAAELKQIAQMPVEAYAVKADNAEISPAKKSWFQRAKNYATAAAAGLLLSAGIAGAALAFNSPVKDNTLETKVAVTRTAENKTSPIVYAASSKREVFKVPVIEEPRIELPAVSEIPESAGEIADIDLHGNYDNKALIADPPVGIAYSANAGNAPGEPIPIKDRTPSAEEEKKEIDKMRKEAEEKKKLEAQNKVTPAPAPRDNKGGLFRDENQVVIQPYGSVGMGYTALSGDKSGHEARADFGFSAKADNGWDLDGRFRYSDKSESWKTANNDDVDKTTTSIRPELSLTGKDKLFKLGYNHVASDETMTNSSHDVNSWNESGFAITQTDMSNMEQKTKNSLDVFSADAKMGKFRLFGELGSNKSKSDYNEGMSTIVDISGFPPIVVNNDVTTTTNATTSFYRLGAGYDFGDVEAGALGRHRETDWSAKGELNGASILDESGSSKQDTFGLYAKMNRDNLEAGATLLGSTGDDLESSQKIEGALHGNYLFNDKFVAGAGLERSDGGTKARGVFMWKLNDSKTGKEVLQNVGDYMSSAENDNLFPDATTKDQKNEARTGRNMSAAADGLLFAIEGGKEGVDKGDYLRADLGAPLPYTNGKAYVYGSYFDGDLEKRVEGGVGVKLNKNFSFTWNYFNDQDKENDQNQSGTGPGLSIRF